MNIKKKKIGDIATIIDGDRGNNYPKQNEFSPSGYCLFLNAGNVTANGFVFDDNSYITQEKDALLRKGRLSRGDIVYTTRGTIGNVAYYSNTIPYEHLRINSGMVILRVNVVEANAAFLYQYLKSAKVREYFLSFKTGSAQPQLPIKNFSAIEIDLPDLPTQRRIASILSAYDDLIENNRRQIKLLEEAAQRLYREWFVELRFPGHESVKVVDGVPEGWMKGTLNTIAEFTGKKANKAERERYKCYLPIDCLPKKSLAYINHDNISNAESSLLSFAKYDIIFGAMRPYFHKVVIAQEEGLTRSTCFVINSRSKEYWSYVCMLLFSEEAIDYATHVSVGTTMPYVRWKDFERMPVLIPSQKVAAHFHEMLLPIIQKISCIAKHIALLSEARDRLLPKLMSGEMEV